MAGTIRLAILGDGIALGQGDPQGLGFAGRLVAWLEDRAIAIEPVWIGGSRWTSADVANRGLAEIEARLGRCGVLACFGGRDCEDFGQTPALSPDLSVAAMIVVTRALADRGPLFMVGPPPTGDAVVNARIAPRARALRTIAEQVRVPHFAAYEAMMGAPAWMADMRGGDGVHPGAAGYAALATEIWASVAWRGWIGAED
jgi:lysophospholipase L1-like esterase